MKTIRFFSNQRQVHPIVDRREESKQQMVLRQDNSLEASSTVDRCEDRSGHFDRGVESDQGDPFLCHSSG